MAKAASPTSSECMHRFMIILQYIVCRCNTMWIQFHISSVHIHVHALIFIYFLLLFGRQTENRTDRSHGNVCWDVPRCAYTMHCVKRYRLFFAFNGFCSFWTVEWVRGFPSQREEKQTGKYCIFVGCHKPCFLRVCIIYLQRCTDGGTISLF